MQIAHVREFFVGELARRAKEQAITTIARLRLRERNFSIISNNCWGAHVYQQFNMPYLTPFVGLFLAPECYLRFLSEFRYYLDRPLTFHHYSRHEYINKLRADRNLSYPIGCIDDVVEIHFMHYSSEGDAVSKWTRRSRRVPSDDDKLYVKFCDRDGCTRSQLEQFDRLPFKNKVCFVSQPAAELRSGVWIPNCNDGRVPDGVALSRVAVRYFDVVDWIRGGNGRPVWPASVRHL